MHREIARYALCELRRSTSAPDSHDLRRVIPGAHLSPDSSLRRPPPYTSISGPKRWCWWALLTYPVRDMAQPPYASRFLRALLPHEKERLIDGVVESSFSAAEEREIHLSHAGAAVKRGQAQLAARARTLARAAPVRPTIRSWPGLSAVRAGTRCARRTIWRGSTRVGARMPGYSMAAAWAASA